MGSQTQITPSSDPEIKRFPSAQYAKQVTALLKQKKKKNLMIKNYYKLIMLIKHLIKTILEVEND